MGVYDSILVTGSGGMLAKALIAQLKTRGHDPVAPNRAALDITSFADVMQTIEKLKPTLVLNCAAHTKVDLCEEQEELATQINGNAVALLAAVAKDVGAKFVHYSTDFVFNGSSMRPWREDDPVGPLSAYGRSKLAGEKAIASEGGENWLILRTAWLYGPGGPCFPMTMINAARAGKPLKVVDDQIGSPTFTHDLAEATLNLLDANATGIYHVVNSGDTNWHDFTAAILEEFSLNTELSRTDLRRVEKAPPEFGDPPRVQRARHDEVHADNRQDHAQLARGAAAYHQALDATGT